MYEDLELKNSDEKKNMKYYFDKCIQFMVRIIDTIYYRSVWSWYA